MARYFFDFTSNNNLTQDDEGSEFDELQDVRTEVVTVLPELAKNLKIDSDQHTFAVTARDVTGRPVFQAKLSFDCAWLE